MNQETIDFIRLHADDDVRQLALRSSRTPNVDMAFALSQIAGRQSARQKLPSWAAVEGIVYPPHLSMEQCSSEQTARYKAGIVEQLAPTGESSVLVDLTGGFGVDFSFMSVGFGRAVYVERQQHLCEAALANFRLLGQENTEVVHGDGVEYLRSMECVTVVYIDPARRDDKGGRTFAMADCTPNVVEIRAELARKAGWVVLKLSPMLDWHQAVRELQPELTTHEVHIVSVGNECKELLLVLSARPCERLRLFCVNDSDMFECDGAGVPVPVSARLAVPCYLYEPNASIMKSGCFGELAHRFGVDAIGLNSHLFVSDELRADFPGRKFRVERLTSMSKRELSVAMSGVERANVAVRNFPMTAVDLRKRLRLKDGGDVYVFGTTVAEKQHILLITRKIS